MKLKAILIAAFASLFMIQSIAEAASISTRVRILESKVYKQTKQIKQQEAKDKAQDERLNKGLSEIETLKFEVERYMRQAEKQKKKSSVEDKNYAFP